MNHPYETQKVEAAGPVRDAWLAGNLRDRLMDGSLLILLAALLVLAAAY
jgi:hypothetical protein